MRMRFELITCHCRWWMRWIPCNMMTWIMFYRKLASMKHDCTISVYTWYNILSSMSWFKNHVTPMLTQWSYIFLSLTHSVDDLKITNMRKTTRLKSGWGFGQTNPPLSTARVLIDAVGLCLLRVSEVWWLFAPDLRRWINSFSGSDFKPRLVYKTWYFCYFFTNFGQQF